MPIGFTQKEASEMATKVDLQPAKLARFVEEVVEVSKTELDRQKAIDLIHPTFKEMLAEPH